MPTKVLTACQARAARAMMDVSRLALAKKSRVSDSSIRRIEIGFGVPEEVTLDLRDRLQRYFEGRGFEFRWDEVLGVGVYWNRNRGRRERRSGSEDRRMPATKRSSRLGSEPGLQGVESGTEG